MITTPASNENTQNRSIFQVEKPLIADSLASNDANFDHKQREKSQ